MIYSPEQFKQLQDEFVAKESEILEWKRGEYAAGGDRLENFRTIADFLNIRPAEVALLYMLKHIQSITVAVQQQRFTWAWETDGGEAIKQRLADARNYLLFIGAALEEEANEHMQATQTKADRSYRCAHGHSGCKSSTAELRDMHGVDWGEMPEGE